MCARARRLWRTGARDQRTAKRCAAGRYAPGVRGTSSQAERISKLWRASFGERGGGRRSGGRSDRIGRRDVGSVAADAGRRPAAERRGDVSAGWGNRRAIGRQPDAHLWPRDGSGLGRGSDAYRPGGTVGLCLAGQDADGGPFRRLATGDGLHPHRGRHGPRHRWRSAGRAVCPALCHTPNRGGAGGIAQPHRALWSGLARRTWRPRRLARLRYGRRAGIVVR